MVGLLAAAESAVVLLIRLNRRSHPTPTGTDCFPREVVVHEPAVSARRL
jgi:hypothetical protein